MNPMFKIIMVIFSVHFILPFEWGSYVLAIPYQLRCFLFARYQRIDFRVPPELRNLLRTKDSG